MSKELKYYYVSGISSWYVVLAIGKRQARRNGRKAFSEYLRDVHEATQAEIDEFKTQREIETAED